MKRYSELITLPIALAMMFIFNLIGQKMGWHLYGAEILQQLFIGLVEFLVIIAIARILFQVTFPRLYEYIDADFDKNNKWNILTEKQKVYAGLSLLALYTLIYALLVANL